MFANFSAFITLKRAELTKSTVAVSDAPSRPRNEKPFVMSHVVFDSEGGAVVALEGTGDSRRVASRRCINQGKPGHQPGSHRYPYTRERITAFTVLLKNYDAGCMFSR